MSNTDKLIELKKIIEYKKQRAIRAHDKCMKSNMKKFTLIHGVRADTLIEVLNEVEKLIN